MSTSSSAPLEVLHEHAAAQLYAKGGIVIPPTREPGAVVHVPYALLPRFFPSKAFVAAKALAQPFNQLVDAIARKPEEWLFPVLEQTAAADPFTGKLVEIAKTVVGEGIRQPFYLGIHRSDYMVDSGEEVKIRQIELNTVSSAFAGLSARIARMHRYLLQRFIVASNAPPSPEQPCFRALLPALKPYADALNAAVGSSKTAPNITSLLSRFHPGNECDTGVADGLAAGHHAYGVSSAVVLFVVQPGERNILDQRALEHALWERHGIRARRATLEWVGRYGKLGKGQFKRSPAALAAAAAAAAASNGAGASPSSSSFSEEDLSSHCLLVPSEEDSASGDQSRLSSPAAWDEVSVVYYRAGYAPTDFRLADESADCEAEKTRWTAKLMAERSVAVKCPPILYHLVGTKKVQQALANKGEVEKFVDAATATQLRSCFAGLWSLDPKEKGEEESAAIDKAKREPHGFVVKPQREGGGNNIFGEAVAAALSGDGRSKGGMSDSVLAAHILMERVFPPIAPSGHLCRLGQVATAPCVSELGIYSVFLGDGGASGRPPLRNVSVGQLLRTKAEGTDEGGVAAGYAVLDSLFLVE